MTRQFAEQRKLGQGLAKIGGATLALSLILEVRQCSLRETHTPNFTGNRNSDSNCGAMPIMELPLMSRSSKLRLILADDHPVLREGLSLILGLLPDMAVVGQASTGEEAFELFLKLEPDVLILDLQMPGQGACTP